MAQANVQSNMFSNLMSFAKGMAGGQGNNQAGNQAPAGGNQTPGDTTFNAALGRKPGQQQDDQNQQNQQNQKQEDPFEIYSKIFEPTDPAKEPQVPKFAVSDEVLGKVAGQIDFMSGLPQELQERLESGEPVDSKTLAALMTHVGRNAYSKAIQHTTNLTDKFVGLRSEYDKQGLNKSVQRVLANNNITKIPGANNPVVKGFLEMTSAALSEKYPDQPPEWVAEKTQKLFLDMAKAMSPQQEEAVNRDPRDISQSEGFDWDKYIGS